MPTPTPYIRYTAELGGTRRLFYGRTPDANGWSRNIGWHADADQASVFTRALGAGVRHVSEMQDAADLERLPHCANNGFE